MEYHENILFSFHVYEQWNNQDIAAHFDALQAQNIPIIVGEYGSSNSSQDTLLASQKMLEAAQEREIGRIVWTVKADDNNDLTMGPGGHAEHFDGTNYEILTELGQLVWDDLQRTEDLEQLPNHEHNNLPLELSDGVFEVDASGAIKFDFLFDGVWTEGELAIFNLEGMENYIPGTQEFIYQAALRATFNSEQGYIILQDTTEGARFSGGLNTGIDWEYNSNFGQYLDVKTYAMNPGDRFGLMFLRNSTIQEIVDDSSIIWQTGKLPFFSIPEANPGFSPAQMVAVDNYGTFAFEDSRIDWNEGDRDYNDIVFQLLGGSTSAPSMDDWVNIDRDWRITDVGEDLLEYTSRFGILDRITVSSSNPKIIANGIDMIQVSKTNFALELGLIFNSDSVIEQIDGSEIEGILEIRAHNIAQDNLWDFSEIELVNVDVINGRNGHDGIIGSAVDDSIKGESGSDTLDGGIGNDLLDGGNDNDFLSGGVGADTIIGGRGLDTLDGGEDGDVYLARHDNIDVYSDTGSNGIDVIQAMGRTNFALKLGLIFDSDSGIERIDGSQIAGNLEIRAHNLSQDNLWDFSEIELVNVDVINGRNGNDSIIGSVVDDSIQGDSGNDTLDGGLGNDTLNGGNDNDFLFGGAGDNTLTGGRGKDSFVFNSPNEGVDTITDFSVKNDTLIFSTAGFGEDLAAGVVNSNLFTLGTAATSEQHRFIYNVNSGYLFYDSDGNGDNEQVKIALLNSGLNLGNENLSIGLA